MPQSLRAGTICLLSIKLGKIMRRQVSFPSFPEKIHTHKPKQTMQQREVDGSENLKYLQPKFAGPPTSGPHPPTLTLNKDPEKFCLQEWFDACRCKLILQACLSSICVGTCSAQAASKAGAFPSPLFPSSPSFLLPPSPPSASPPHLPQLPTNPCHCG